MKIPTNEQIDVVLQYLPVLKRPGLVLSKVQGGEVDAQGVMSMPWESKSEEVRGLIAALYQNQFMGGFDWPSWQGTASEYVGNPELIRQADLSTLKKLLITHVRKDRFCEGHFTEMIRCGHITAILERLAELRRQGQSA